MKKNSVLIIAVVLLIASPILCLESLVSIIERDEQEELILNRAKEASVRGDSIKMKEYRDTLLQFGIDTESKEISDLLMFGSSILFGITGLSLLIWKIFIQRNRITRKSIYQR